MIKITINKIKEDIHHINIERLLYLADTIRHSMYINHRKPTKCVIYTTKNFKINRKQHCVEFTKATFYFDKRYKFMNPPDNE
jgi:hypothetical protein